MKSDINGDISTTAGQTIKILFAQLIFIIFPSIYVHTYTRWYMFIYRLCICTFIYISKRYFRLVHSLWLSWLLADLLKCFSSVFFCGGCWDSNQDKKYIFLNNLIYFSYDLSIRFFCCWIFSDIFLIVLSCANIFVIACRSNMLPRFHLASNHISIFISLAPSSASKGFVLWQKFEALGRKLVTTNLNMFYATKRLYEYFSRSSFALESLGYQY